MANGVMGVVRLAPGRVGYFDEITRIHLTIQTPEKPVLEGMNTTNLKLAVRSGSIKLVSGSLEPVPAEIPSEIEEIVIKTPSKSKAKKEVNETVSLEKEVKTEETLVEEIKESEVPLEKEEAEEEKTKKKKKK